MDVTMLISRCREFKAQLIPEGQQLRIRAPEPLPSTLVEQLKAHKEEIISILKLQGYRQKYNTEEASTQELNEIARRVNNEGYVLLWSTVLNDLVAFYRDEDARSKIPPGFVAYSDDELQELFGEGRQSASEHTLRLIHEAKKQGGRVIDIR